MKSLWRCQVNHAVHSVEMERRIGIICSSSIQDLRLVRGALLVSISGGKIERELANVNIAFLQLFLIVLIVTVGLVFI